MDRILIKRNILSSLILQVVSILCGFIVPKAILSAFGSETNGLISSISQFLNYVTILEGGVSGVITAALYKPLAERDNRKMNAVMNAARKFFFQLGLICTAYSIVVAIVYPILKKTQFSFGYVFALTLVLSCSLMMQYFFALSYSLLIKADRKVYVFNITHTISVVLNGLLVLLSIRCFHDVLIVKVVTAVVYALNPVFYSYYAHKHYHLDSKIQADEDAISQRWDGFGQTMAYFVHSNTDIVILTVFSSLSDVSVYSIYLLIASAMRGVVTAVSGSVAPSIGNLIGQGDKEKVRDAYYQYEYGLSLISLCAFSCCVALIVPFVSVYTQGVNDANYIQPVFGRLIVLAELVYCLRDPSTGLIYAAGHFKQTANFAYAEAGLNIVISLCLVQRYNLVGVAAGTLFAMLLRWALHIVYLKKNIVFISGRETLKIVVTSLLDIGTLLLVCKLFVPNTVGSYIEWTKYGICVFLITILIIAVTNYLLNKNRFVGFLKMCFNKSCDSKIK